MERWWLNRWVVYQCDYNEDKFNKIILNYLKVFSERDDIPLVLYMMIINYTEFYYYNYDSYWPPTPETPETDEDDDDNS